MKTTEVARDAAAVLQFMSFSVGDQEYGVELTRVKEVIRVPGITWLPRAPSFVKGIINLRGDVMPIIDLRDRFGLEPRAHTAETRVTVVEIEGHLVGIVVDSASQVVRIPGDQIEPPPGLGTGGSAELITGVGKLDDRLMLLLDVDAVLSPEEKVALSSVSNQQ
jgi:purine-binding chemotaxis protein CheW